MPPMALKATTILLTVLAHGAVSSALAQRAPASTATVTIAEHSGCAACRVHLDSIVTLVDTSGFDIAGRPRGVLLLPDQRSLVTVNVPNTTPTLFAEDGRFERQLGSVGSGPGEFRLPQQARLLPPDTVVVFDVMLSRVSYFDRSLRFVRSVQAPALPESGWLNEPSGEAEAGAEPVPGSRGRRGGCGRVLLEVPTLGGPHQDEHDVQERAHIAGAEAQPEEEITHSLAVHRE
jgi:hypothetical protein